MTASLFQGEGGYMSVVGENPTAKLPKPIAAMKQGSEGPVRSDLQQMQHDERKQHEDTYRYENGHNDDNTPLGQPSF